jgi:hypothetical protein
MAVIVPVVTTYNAKGINKAISDFKKLETTGQKMAFGLRGADQATGALVKGLAKAGAVAGVAGAIIGRSLIKSASDLQESVSKINAVFGNSSRTVIAWSETTAKALGVSQRQALEAAGTYGNLFQAFGMSAPQAQEMSMSLVELAADMASFNNVPIEDALLALRSGLSGEAEPLKRFGVAINDARLKQEALNMGLYNGKGVLSVASKSQAAYALILKDTALQQGDVARTSDGVAFKMKSFSAQVADVQSQIGTALIPIFSSLMSFMNDRVLPVFVEFADVLGKEGLGASLGVLADGFFSFTSSLGTTGTTILTLIGAVTALRGATIAYNIVMGVSAAILPIFMKSLQGATVAQTQLNVAMYANPIGLVVAAVVAFVAVMAILYMRFEAVRKAVNFVGDALIFLVKNTIALVQNTFISFINLAIDGFNLLIKAANLFGAGFDEIPRMSYVAFHALGENAKGATKDIYGVQEALRQVRNEERALEGKTLLPPVDPPGPSGAAKQIETAKQKLEKYTSALEKVKGSSERLMSANKSLVSSQKRVTEATKSVESAQAKLAESVDAVTVAEANLERVRSGLGIGSAESQKAARDVADAQRELENAGYGVEDSQFALLDAESELQALRLNAEATTRDLREAEINLARAKISLTESQLRQTDQTEKLKDLQTEFNEVTNGAGEGTERYTEAMDALTEAKLANQEASIALDEAKQNEIEANEDLEQSVKDLTKAQWDLFDAEKALAELRNTTPAGVVSRAEADIKAREEAPVASGLPFKSFMDAVRALHPNSPTLGKPDALNASRSRFPLLYKEYQKAGLAFAKGGIVTSPTIGLVGEAGAEAIIPLDKLQTGTVINVTVNAGMGADGGQIGNEIVDALKRYQRRNGSIPISVTG